MSSPSTEIAQTADAAEQWGEPVGIEAADGTYIEVRLRRLSGDELAALMHRPALGAILARPDVQRHIAEHRWLTRCRLVEHIARRRAERHLGDAHHALHVGQRPDLVAADLRAIAGLLDTAGHHAATTEAAA